ncbi:hypothetical protein [Streptomyces sp. CA-111067]|uniref:hypothetical protein n=1 Tax=Streptomyces sp. CA-111067 TaxID=3240046 RepID=UPI003D98B48C
MEARHGILALMGSGETSPTMVTLHRELATSSGLGPDAGAVILETPYGFQVNRDDISARARQYFQRSVGLATAVVPDEVRLTSVEADRDRLRDQVRTAGWVFSGPGSPSYALGRWRDQGLGQVLVDRVRRGYGVTVMASAAACTVGLAALPVYEVYKAGHPPAWLDGLDLLGVLGLAVAVIPHYDNAEGGTHDTRFCYLGETRLAVLEEELPGGSAVLGIDEHTAVVIDLADRVARVWGKGVMTVRRHGVSTEVPAGSVLPLDALRGLLAGTVTSGSTVPRQSAAGPDDAPAETGGPATLQETASAAETRFATARAAGDAERMVEAVLDLEDAITQWGADTEEDEGGQQWARTILRGMLRQLAQPARQGMVEPERTLGRVLDPLLDLRRELRVQGAYELADRLRASLAAGGVQLRDDARGSRWRLLPVEPEQSSGSGSRLL